VDGDLAHEIDAREMPADWPTGYFARETKKTYDPKKPPVDGEIFHLNPSLVEWAYQLTRLRPMSLDPSERTRLQARRLAALVQRRGILAR
jgi:purine nucleoside permease